jgi:hypothetical protein
VLSHEFGASGPPEGMPSDPSFRLAEPDRVVVILKAREPARYLVAIGKEDRGHLEFKRFSGRRCLNQHHWLARRRAAEGITFRQAGNMFLTCSDPARLQTLADALTPRDLDRGGQKWLRALVPCFTPTERRVCAHRLFFAQVEYSDTAVFHRRAALDAALPEMKRDRLDRLSQRIVTDLDARWRAVGWKAAHDSQLKTQDSELKTQTQDSELTTSATLCAAPLCSP